MVEDVPYSFTSTGQYMLSWPSQVGFQSTKLLQDKKKCKKNFRKTELKPIPWLKNHNKNIFLIKQPLLNWIPPQLPDMRGQLTAPMPNTISDCEVHSKNI